MTLTTSVQFSLDGQVLQSMSCTLPAHGLQAITVALSSLQAGSHKIMATIDPNDVIRERREDNNSKEITFEVIQPDLMVVGLGGTKTSYLLGDSLGGSFEVRNQGKGGANNSFIVNYYLASAEGSDKTTYFLGQQTVETGLEAGASVLKSIDAENWTIPESVEPGSYRVFALVDAGNSIPNEADEQNNWGQSESFSIARPDKEPPTAVFVSLSEIAIGGTQLDLVIDYQDNVAVGQSCVRLQRFGRRLF